MIYSLIEALFGIIKLIWNAPFWLVVVVIVILAVINILQGIFGVPNSDNTGSAGYEVESVNTYTDNICQIEFEKVDQPFVFYDYSGDRCGRDDCFCDSKGEHRCWGDGFYDGKGYYRKWGD